MLNVPPIEQVLEFPKELLQIFDNVSVVTAFQASKSQIFISYKTIFSMNGRNLPLGLIIEFINYTPSKYFISLSEVLSLYVSINFRHGLIGGTKEGSMLL